MGSSKSTLVKLLQIACLVSNVGNFRTFTASSVILSANGEFPDDMAGDI